MHGSPKRRGSLGTGIVAFVTVTGVACGQGGVDERTPTLGAPPPGATFAASSPATTPAATAAAAGAAATTLTLVAKDTLFDKSELKAKAGTVTIVVDNQDTGLPHNIHVFKGNDNTGEDLGKTQFLGGPAKQTLKLQLTAGEYFFVCEVHPATMFGTLVVE